MPGYFIHIASASKDIRNSKLALKGIIAPDLWKWKTPTLEEYSNFFNDLSNSPSYEQVQFLCSLEHGGTHFGSSPSDTSHANFTLLKELFATGQLDADNPFFKGYIHHLHVDYKFYSDESICNIKLFNKDYSIDAKATSDLAHSDWDKTNTAIAKWYPEVLDIISTMPKEIQEIISFIDGTPKYISLNSIHQFIQNMQKEQTLSELLNC